MKNNISTGTVGNKSSVKNCEWINNKMKNASKFPFWSDNWCVEGNKAWFVAGQYNAIFEFDFETKNCGLGLKIPSEHIHGFRINSNCVKYGNSIYCIPDFGNKIWIYCTKTGKFSAIEIRNSQNVRLGMLNIGFYRNRMLLFSRGLQKIFELDPQKNVIIEKCNLSEISEIPIFNIIKVENYLYGISLLNGDVLEIDLEENTHNIYEIKNGTNKLNTICYDGNKLWMCGFKKEIYVWEKGSSKVEIINNLPSDFGIYCEDADRKIVLDKDKNEYEMPTFITAQCIGADVWFIPFQTNKILRINKNNVNEVQVFEIEAEEVNKDKLWKGYSLNHKYLLEYVKDDRYLGLFSLKNDKVLQIDTVKDTYEYLDIHISNDLFVDEKSKDIFIESNKIHAIMYEQMIKCKDISTILELNENIGNKIWKLMFQD